MPCASIIRSNMEKVRSFDIQFMETSACTNDVNCPLRSILENLTFSTESFLEFAETGDQNLFKSINYSVGEDGKFKIGELSIKCRYKPERNLGFECGEIMFRIFAPQDIKPDKSVL